MTTATTALHVPATVVLLDAWESALTADPADRALHVLQSMCDGGCDHLADRPTGDLNRLLLQARTLLFGGECDAIAECRCCGTELEATIPLPALSSAEGALCSVGETTIGDIRVSYRLPSWRDLAALADQSVDDAAGQLLARCLTSITSGQRRVELGELDPETVDAIDEAIFRADPDTLITVQLICPDCGETARLPMEPATFLWDEVDRWAVSVLSQVAELAAAFGWSEDSILAMTPGRRQMYLLLADGRGAR
jgi:hypothetical protein